MAKIIGIDLSTSNSASAVMMGGRPTVISSAEGTSVDGKYIDKIRGRIEALTNVFKEVVTIAYQQTSTSQESSSGQSDRTDSTGRKVMVAEYKVDQAQNEQRS